MKSIFWLAGATLLIVALVLILAAPKPVHAAGTVRYASPNGKTTGNCDGSWANACTLQRALTVAVSGDEIWVKAGVHYPGASGLPNLTFQLKSGVAIYGGFNGTETSRDQRNWTANKTILSGDIDKNDTNTDGNFIAETAADINGSNSYHVVTGSGTDNTAVLDGFIITAGQANQAVDPHYYGGGMYNNSGSPTLINLTFSGNLAYTAGGGMYNKSGSPTLTNVIFSGNRVNGGSNYGGGMYNYSSSPTLTNVIFSGNMGNGDYSYGGGMYNANHSSPKLTNVIFAGNKVDGTYNSYGGGMYNVGFSSPILTNVTFFGNRTLWKGGSGGYGGGMSNINTSNPNLNNVTFYGNSASYGGGMYNNERSNPTLTNVTFSGNSASNYGGGMANIYYSSPTLTNVTFSGNSASNFGGGMYNNNNSSPTLTNIILWGNTATNGAGIYNNNSTPTISYSDIQGGYTGTGNINADPRFVDADGADNIAGTPDDNLRLQRSSPAIDAGKNAAVPADVTTDLDGKQRFWDITTVTDTGSGTPPIVDMGAYEVVGLLYAAPSAVGSGDCTSWTNACTLQTALSGAASGDEIWVKEGVHYPGASGNRSASFQLKNGVAIYGGFAGTETQRSQRDWQTHPTILSGDIDNASYPDDHGGDFINENASQIQGNNAYHVVTGSNTDNTAVLDGFIITAGQANGYDPQDSGGGMYNSSGSPTLTNLTFSGNSASYSGGGMYNDHSNPTLTNITFSANQVTDLGGGGMGNSYSNPILTNVTFSSNTAYSGGGMYNNNNSSPTLTNVIFSANQAENGGGMYTESISSPTLSNVTFSANSATSGGGMYNNDNSNPTLTNAIIWGNTATTVGVGIYNNSSTPTISYSLLQESGCPSGATCGSGMIYNTDPRFVDADGLDNTPGTLDDNLRLEVTSPAIDAGNNAAVPVGVTTDLDGKPRFWDVPTVTDTGSGTPPIVDMGAYELWPLYAAPSGLTTGTCDSWANACTLQYALNLALSGHEIWVKEGVHYPGASGNRSASFQLKSGVAIYGGFAGTETQRSQRDWQTHPTILSGDIDNNDTNTDGNFIAETWNDIKGYNAYNVVTGSGTGSTAVLDGFIITAGQANGYEPDDTGGGMYNYSGSPTLTNLTFSGNSASYSGGGMYNDHSNPTLTNITFSANQVTDLGGGGMGNSYSNPILTNVAFFSNTAYSGGGMYNNNNSSPTLTNVIFSANQAENGGGMYTESISSPTLSNVTFSANSATSGGGMYNNDNSNPTLTNAIIWGNTATTVGVGIYNNSSTPTISYSLLQESGCPSGATCGSGMIYNTDPRFVDADGLDNTPGTLDDNLRLEVTSPAIDAGNNAAVPVGVTTDLDGKPRFWDVPTVTDTGSGTPPIVDMGAYELWPLYAAPSGLTTGTCDSWANACTLQYALNLALSGHEIWVKAGVHYPGTAGNRSATFQLKSGVAIYGGFAGTEAQRSQRNWTANKTILSGDIGRDDITDPNGVVTDTAKINGENAYHVVTGSNTNSNAVLDGFIITAGQANGDEPDYSGGGMYNYSGSPTLTNLTFSGNTASYGGGMANNFYSSPTLTNVTFSGNSASSYGGGMDNNFASSPTLTNVTFSGNSASNFGGGMVNAVSSAPMLTNVTFSGNSASNYGGGMYNANNSSPTLTNVIVWGNTATNGAGIYNANSTPIISYSDIQGCIVSGSWTSACGTDGGGNLDADPRFVDAANGNLRLDFGSPAIESGTNTGCPSTDLDGLPRPADGDGNSTATCDMGAYEAGTMICSAPYTFNSQSGVSITITAPGNLACIYVDEMETNHPNATPGLQTGRYWLIRGLQNDKQTNASGFTLNLTLPTSFTPDANDKGCRYTGSGQVWDCGDDPVTITGNSITRENITALSDWAVGNDVGPTSVKLRDIRAHLSPSPITWLFAVTLAIGLWFRKTILSH